MAFLPVLTELSESTEDNSSPFRSSFATFVVKTGSYVAQASLKFTT